MNLESLTDDQYTSLDFDELVNLFIPILYSYRIGSRPQCRRLAIELLQQLKYRGVDL